MWYKNMAGFSFFLHLLSNPSSTTPTPPSSPLHPLPKCLRTICNLLNPAKIEIYLPLNRGYPGDNGMHVLVCAREPSGNTDTMKCSCQLMGLNNEGATSRETMVMICVVWIIWRSFSIFGCKEHLCAVDVLRNNSVVNIHFLSAQYFYALRGTSNL